MDYPNVFYACEIGHLESEIIYENALKHVCKIYGFNEYRQDEHGTIGKIDEQIFRAIDNSSCFFAEISQNNRNVFIELGYALAKLGSDKIVLFKNVEKDYQDKEILPFDIASQNTIFYKIKPHHLIESTEEIQNRLIHFFSQPESRITFYIKSDEDIIFHFPIDSVDSFTFGPEKTEGGQKINEYGNIEIDHRGDNKGNWKTDRTDSCSIMRLISIEQSKVLINEDRIELRIRARVKGDGSVKFTFIGDGASRELKNKVGEHIAAFHYDNKDLNAQEKRITNFQEKLDMRYKQNNEEQFVNDIYLIKEHGLQLYLGTETIGNCNVEIYEIQMLRKK